MSLASVNNLASDVGFIARVAAALVNYAHNTVFLEAANDVQTITVTGSPTGGSFTLSGGPLTAAVAPGFNWTAQQIQAAFNTSTTLPSGASCVCMGGPLPGTVVTVTWTGTLANSPQNALTVSANNLTGGTTPNAAIGHTFGVAALNHAARVTKASSILAGPNQAASVLAWGVANDPTVQTDYTTGGNLQTAVTDAHINAAVGNIYNDYI